MFVMAFKFSDLENWWATLYNSIKGCSSKIQLQLLNFYQIINFPLLYLLSIFFCMSFLLRGFRKVLSLMNLQTYQSLQAIKNRHEWGHECKSTVKKTLGRPYLSSFPYSHLTPTAQKSTAQYFYDPALLKQMAEQAVRLKSQLHCIQDFNTYSLSQRKNTKNSKSYLCQKYPDPLEGRDSNCDPNPKKHLERKNQKHSINEYYDKLGSDVQEDLRLLREMDKLEHKINKIENNIKNSRSIRSQTVSEGMDAFRSNNDNKSGLFGVQPRRMLPGQNPKNFAASCQRPNQRQKVHSLVSSNTNSQYSSRARDQTNIRAVGRFRSNQIPSNKMIELETETIPTLQRMISSSDSQLALGCMNSQVWRQQGDQQQLEEQVRRLNQEFDSLIFRQEVTSNNTSNTQLCFVQTARSSWEKRAIRQQLMSVSSQIASFRSITSRPNLI